MKPYYFLNKFGITKKEALRQAKQGTLYVMAFDCMFNYETMIQLGESPKEYFLKKAIEETPKPFKVDSETYEEVLNKDLGKYRLRVKLTI